MDIFLFLVKQLWVKQSSTLIFCNHSARFHLSRIETPIAGGWNKHLTELSQKGAFSHSLVTTSYCGLWAQFDRIVALASLPYNSDHIVFGVPCRPATSEKGSTTQRRQPSWRFTWCNSLTPP